MKHLRKRVCTTCGRTCRCGSKLKQYKYMDGPFAGGVYYDRERILDTCQKRGGFGSVDQPISLVGFNDSGEDADHRVPSNPRPGRIVCTYKAIGYELWFTGRMRWVAA